MRLLLSISLGAVLLSFTALAQEPELGNTRAAQGWSTLSGQTVGAGENVLVGQVGWPGISGAFLHGLSANLDLGGSLAFNYGEEGALRTVTPGLKLQGVLRYNLLESASFNLGVSFAPGAFFYFHTYATRSGLSLPVGLQLGIPVGAALMVHAGVDLPFYVTFGSTGWAALPILAGGGVEYFINSNLAGIARVRVGPTLQGDNRPTVLTLEAAIGVAYKL